MKPRERRVAKATKVTHDKRGHKKVHDKMISCIRLPTYETKQIRGEDTADKEETERSTISNMIQKNCRSLFANGYVFCSEKDHAP